tara:strand:+ start:26 stop:181 length:156 start_codon:yes stop_codon:yes gene_type:complete
MEIILIIWGAGIVYCIIEAIFFTELDPESRRFLEKRENKLNKEENEYKSNS